MHYWFIRPENSAVSNANYNIKYNPILSWLALLNVSKWETGPSD